MMKHLKLWSMLVLLLLFPSFALAQEEDGPKDLEILGLEVEKLLFLGSGLLAAALCFFTFSAYKRSGHDRLKFVALAFLLFGVKSFLKASELFLEEIVYIDPIAAFLDFAVLLSFFYGVMKR